MTDFGYQEWLRAAVAAEKDGRYSQAGDIRELAKEARRQTLRAEMLDARLAVMCAEHVVERACRNEYETESASEREAVQIAREAYAEARKAWMLMGGQGG